MNWLKKISHWLLPELCVLCRHPTGNGSLCTPCTTELPWLIHACSRCAQPLMSVEMTEGLCGRCLQKPPLFQVLLAPLAYESPVDHLILSLKFANKLQYAKVLSDLLIEALANYYSTRPLPELIIPVPLHFQRLRERGFNQAVEIAKPLHKKLGIPLGLHQCKRLIATESQATIAANERLSNVKNAFWVNPSLQARHVAIVDDVVTTGSTVSELTRMLIKAGVRQVDVWCCARTCRK